MYQETMPSATYEVSPTICLTSSSTFKEEISSNHILTNSISVWTRKRSAKKNRRSSFGFDDNRSSTQPHLETIIETWPLEEAAEKNDPENYSDEELALEMIEHDYIVNMPPKKSYKIHMVVNSIKKGEPGDIIFNGFSNMD